MEYNFIDNQESLHVWDKPNEASELYAENSAGKNVSAANNFVASTCNSKTADSRTSDKTASEIASQIAYVERCVPNWKQTFPWVCWCSEDRVLYCLHCRELIRRYFSDKIEKSNVFHIADSDGIFTVAQTLRAHHTSSSHVAAIYLYSQGALSSFIALFNEHSKEMKTEEEVIEVAKSVFDYSGLEKDGFAQTIKGMGKYIEQKLVESVKQSKNFSVVADQCRGILILRWMNGKGEVVEHVFWSYISVWNMTPLQYLNKFDLDMEKMSLYIANSLCQHCPRCENVKVEPASLPPRPPSTVSFASILWRLDFLRPLSSLIRTIYKLYRRYPYKFAQTLKPADFRNLEYFEIKPVSAIKIMNNFEAIKSVALDIYSKEARPDALGLAMVNLKNDDKHKKILTLLQEIIDTVKTFTLLSKISEENLVKLNQTYSSLKQSSCGARFVTCSGETLDGGRSDDNIWEFLNFVEKFIDENQKSLYYNGKETAFEFINFFSFRSLVNKENKIDQEKLVSVFQRVVSVYTNPVTLNEADRLKVFKNLLGFYTHLLQHKTNLNSCLDVMKIFHQNPDLQNQYSEAYALFSYCASMPFLNCHIPRSLFVSFIIEQRVEGSVWARMENDLKPWLLYLQTDLEIISSSDLLNWWLNLTN